MQCPICGASLSVQVHRGVRDYEHGLPVVADFDACPSCGLIAQVPPPSATALAGYYPRDYRPHAAAAGANGISLMTRLKDIQASMQIRRLAKFLPACEQPILELGCGGGHFLRALERHGYSNLTGIDRTPELGRAFEGTPIRYRALDLDRSLDLGGPYQAIVMNYVIEHFVSPEAVLRACRKALAPGGRVLLLTPNSRALSHRLFGRYWSGLHAPRHTHPASWTLSFQNLIQGMKRSGAPPRAGTAWYSLALLPAWYPFALVETLARRASSMFAVLTA